MKDQGYEHAHSSPIKTPQQLAVVVVLAFVVPVIGLILLAVAGVLVALPYVTAAVASRQHTRPEATA